MQKQNTIIGHEKRWAALARAFDKGIVPQTLLISGPAQVGKWTLALRYAQLLLCPQPIKIEVITGENLSAPCGHCRVCHQVEIGTFPDFAVFRPIMSSSSDERDWVTAPETLVGSVFTVHIARKFGHEALSKPLVGARKVMLINQADRMTIEAQNALLKTFEEPVRSLSIILLTDNPSQLLPTVASRCWHLPLGLVGDAHIADWLPQISEDASSLRSEWINEAVRVGAGRPGAAYWELRRLQRLATSDSTENQPVKGTGTTTPERKAESAPTTNVSRFAQASAIVERITGSQPVGALGLTEEAIRLARLWWAEDQEEAAKEQKDLKKADAKVHRSAVARFLDELSNAYRAYWVASIEQPKTLSPNPGNGRPAHSSNGDNGKSVWSDGLDQIRKTRHYILHNANLNLALDVMFGCLIALHGVSSRSASGAQSRASDRPQFRSERPPGKAPTHPVRAR